MFGTAFLTYSVIVLIFCALGLCGIMIGKKLRDNKDAKTPVKTLEEESK